MKMEIIMKLATITALIETLGNSERVTKEALATLSRDILEYVVIL